MKPLRVVVAPDSFKTTFTAAAVAEHLAHGVRTAGGDPVLRPLADGGEGTAAALRPVLDATPRTVQVTGPLGQPITAEYLLSADGRTAVIETAAASGLHLSVVDDDNAYAATTAGTGELIAAAVAAGARSIVLGVGGSATTDGGAGAIAAIDAAGGLQGTHITVLCDVDARFLDAASVFGPQKGAGPDTVDRLTRRLDDLARALPRDPRTVARTGAAGGLSGGLWATYDARLVSGIDYILDRLEFDALLGDADVVITGEGRLDVQTFSGKVIAGVAARAAQAGVPVWAVVGRCDLDTAEIHRLGLAGAMEAGDATALEAAAARLTGLTAPTDTAARRSGEHHG